MKRKDFLVPHHIVILSGLAIGCTRACRGIWQQPVIQGDLGMTQGRGRGATATAGASGGPETEPSHSPRPGQVRKSGKNSGKASHAGRARQSPKGAHGRRVRGNAAGSAARGVLPPFVFGLALLIVWDLAIRTGAVDTFYLPAPYDLAKHFVDQVLHGDLRDYTKETVWEALAGSGMGLGVALPLGYLIARSDLAASALQPYLAASQAVPAVALAPLFALWLGYGLLPIAVLCALLVFFPILVNTIAGVRHVDGIYLRAARNLGASQVTMFRRVMLPLITLTAPSSNVVQVFSSS